MSELIELRNLTIAYDRHPAVHHLSGTFEKGGLTALVGPNGAGKSSLIKAIAGLLKPAEGQILLKGVAPGNIAYLPQSSAIDENFPIAVRDVVAMGLWSRIGALGAIGKDMQEEIRLCLEKVGLSGFENRIYGELSTGQRQRVLFARVMAANTSLILLDEPFSAMDSHTIKDLLALIVRWKEEGRTQIVVLHDYALVRNFFPQCLMLARRKIAWGETQDTLTQDNLSDALEMNEAWIENAELCAHDHDPVERAAP